MLSLKRDFKLESLVEQSENEREKEKAPQYQIDFKLVNAHCCETKHATGAVIETIANQNTADRTPHKSVHLFSYHHSRWGTTRGKITLQFASGAIGACSTGYSTHDSRNHIGTFAKFRSVPTSESTTQPCRRVPSIKVSTASLYTARQGTPGVARRETKRNDNNKKKKPKDAAKKADKEN